MASIGTQIIYAASPQSTTPPYDTSNAFLVGLADWGPANTPVTITSLAQTIATVGPRSATNTTIYDSLDVFFREAATATTAFFSRVVGPAASAASLVLTDSNSSAALTVAAVYPGNYGNNINVAVTNASGAFTITLTDTYGTALATSPAFTTRAGAVSWTNSYVTIHAYVGSSLPATIGATPMTGGTDDRAHVGLTQYTTALNSFSYNLGPGQLLAPGVTNTTVSGIWTAIGTAASTYNRVGICDMDDGQSAGTIVADIGSQFNSLSVGPLGFWAGNLAAPGVAPGTTRSIPPSPVIAALCSRVDSTGNPNLPGAGGNFPLVYCTGPATQVSGFNETYSGSDRSTINNAGVNTFSNRFGTYENYGFVSSVLPTTDVTFWQFNHFRLRMAIGAESNAIGETFVFSQLDGAGTDILSFNHQLQSMLGGFLAAGALFGTQPGTPTAAFSVDTGPTVNTPQTMQAGQLNANLYVRMSPYAQLVTIEITTVPITTAVPPGSTSQATGSGSTGF